MTTTQRLLPPTFFPAGSNPQAVGSVPDGFSFALLRVDRTAWSGPVTASDVIKALIEISEDGGTTWGFLLSFTTRGGALYPGQTSLNYVPPPGAVPIPESSAGINLPPGTGRMFRVTANIFADLTTAVAVDWS